MNRALRLCVAALLVASGISAMSSLYLLWRGTLQNWQIALLNTDHDIAVPMAAPPALLTARARYALRHGNVRSAQAIADQFGLLHASSEQADLLYELGNAQLRGALTNFTQLPFRVVAPRLRLAKAQYRQAIQLDPQNWDARYNYALAAALVRDTESSSPTAGDEMAHERAAWPDIPGAPNGMP
jgi:mxaK protein